jgi:hypothetical protein
MCRKQITFSVMLLLTVTIILTTSCNIDEDDPKQVINKTPLFGPQEYEQDELEQFTSPLYLTIIIHTEEDISKCKNPKARIPDYDGNEELTLHFTNAMREFAEMVASHNAKINFGTDWTYSNAIELYDPTFYTDLEAMGHEIDAHAHESCILYHEVREDIVDAGGTPTKVASGMTEGDIYDQMEYFDKYYPEFELLWGVALAEHTAGEETSGWVWRPSRDNWLEHDPEGKYIHIGHGEYANSIEYIQNSVDNIKPNYINTYAVFTNPREFLAAPGTPGIPDEWTAETDSYDYWEKRIEWWDQFLTELDDMEDVEYASLTDIANTFLENEDNLDFDYDTENHPRSDSPGPSRQIKAGYP